MGTQQVQWVHSRNTLVVVTHFTVQIVDPQHLLRLDVIESNLVGLDLSFPTDFLVENHEGLKRQGMTIGDPSKDIWSA